MSDLALPERTRGPFKFLGQLSPDENERLLAALGDLPPLAPIEKMQEAIQAALPDLDASRVRRLSNTIVATAAQLDEEWTPTYLATRIGQSSALELDEDQREALRVFLDSALRLPSLADTAKAAALMSECERTLLNVRIVSDVRPIFGKDPDRTPSGAGVVHTLLLDYLDAGENQRMALDLDESDLRSLTKEAERALKKHQTLRTWIETTDLAYFEYQEEESA